MIKKNIGISYEEDNSMNDYIKAFLILVVIGVTTWFAFYLFNEYKQGQIMKAKAEAAQGLVTGVANMARGAGRF